jgi:hypothetical protein
MVVIFFEIRFIHSTAPSSPASRTTSTPLLTLDQIILAFDTCHFFLLGVKVRDYFGNSGAFDIALSNGIG